MASQDTIAYLGFSAKAGRIDLLRGSEHELRGGPGRPQARFSMRAWPSLS